jgi:hypothetical protein
MTQLLLLGPKQEPEYIVLVGPTGTRVRLYCPFLVICIHPVGTIAALTLVVVTAIRTTQDRRLLYVVQGKAYRHTNFRILIELL